MTERVLVAVSGLPADGDPALGAARFTVRARCPGHLDQRRTAAQVAERVARIRAGHPGPLRLGGPLSTVDTGGPVDVAVPAQEVSALLPL